MTRLTLKLTTVFLFLLAVFAPVTSVPSSAQDTAPVTDVCTGLCLLGIQPGVTSAARAREIFDNHPWVKYWDWSQQVRAGEGNIDWQWNDLAPAAFRPEAQSWGSIIYMGEVVEDMDFDLSVSPGMLFAILGEPPLSGTTYTSSYPFGPPPGVGITAVYPDRGLWFDAVVHCPYDVQVWTNTRVDVHLSDLKHMTYTPYPPIVISGQPVLQKIRDLNKQDCER